MLLDCCRRGEEAVVAEALPEAETEANRVRAAFVRFLALGGDEDAPVHEYGVALRGAWVTGPLAFEDTTLPHALSLRDCQLLRINAWRLSIPILLLGGSRVSEGIYADGLRSGFGLWMGEGFISAGPILLSGARIGGDVDLAKATIEGANDLALVMDFAEVTGSVLFGELRAKGEVNLTGTRIRGDLLCGGARFESGSEFALLFDGAVIGRSVFLRERFHASGTVRLLGATIGNSLDCTAGQFAKEGGIALDAEGARIGGSLFLNSGFQAKGEVSLASATISGSLECQGADIENKSGLALACSWATISRGVSLVEGFKAVGEVSFLGATVGGNLDCNTAHLENAKGSALTLDDASIGRSVFLSNGFRAVGATLLRGTQVGRDIVCWNGNFEYDDSEALSSLARSLDPMAEEGGLNALSLERASVGGNVLLGADFSAEGAVTLFGATIRGSLQCSGDFKNRGYEALVCRRASISGNVRLRSGFHADGSVSFYGSTIGGDLDCESGRFEGSFGVALDCENTSVAGHLILAFGFQATQDVRLSHASIGRSLMCTDGSFDSPSGNALNCVLTRVSGVFFFRQIRSLSGAVDLSSMQVEALNDDLASWSGAEGKLILDGFTYNRLAGSAPTNARDRIRWLGLQFPDHLGPEFRPQPWEHLIAALRKMGHPNEARAVAIARQDRQRRAGKIVQGTRSLHWLYGTLVGYGYRPTRLLGAVAAVWLVSAAAYWVAAHPPSGLSPFIASTREPAQRYDSFSPLVYSADMLLPIVDLGHSEEWTPYVNAPDAETASWARRLRVLGWVEILLGWLFGGALAAMLGNLIKKD